VAKFLHLAKKEKGLKKKGHYKKPQMIFLGKNKSTKLIGVSENFVS